MTDPLVPANEGGAPSGSPERESGYTPGDMPLPEQVYVALQAVEDPEIHQNIVGLGLIYGVELNQEYRKVTVKMTLTTPYCPYGPQLMQETRMVLLALPGVKEAQVDMVWEPVWDPQTMASEDVKDALGMW
ncbi:MAG: metal-sulfur cluster assembly factor [bacterium]